MYSTGDEYQSWWANTNMEDVNFSDNSAERYGGGMFNYYSNPDMSNVTFLNNSAGIDCGAMFNFENTPILENAIFWGNSATNNGGAMCNAANQPTIINTTFANNQAGRGGALYNFGSTPTITNTILWANQAFTTSAQIYNDSGTPLIAYSDIQDSGASGAGWDASLGIDAGGNLDADPLFVDASSGDLHLQPDSPAIDTGDLSVCPSMDLDGTPRPQGVGCDMGAYEASATIYVDAGPDQVVDEGELVQFQGVAVDPDLLRLQEIVAINWDFGDGAHATGTLMPTHTYADNGPVATGGAYTVTLRVADTYSGMVSDHLLVTVENVAPTLSVFPDQEASVGKTITVTGVIADPGTLDTQTVLISWDDGVTETLELSASEREFTLTHAFAQPGDYAVTVRVTDKDGGWDEKGFMVNAEMRVYLPLVIR
jgi:hypothetical protein